MRPAQLGLIAMMHSAAHGEAANVLQQRRLTYGTYEGRHPWTVAIEIERALEFGYEKQGMKLLKEAEADVEADAEARRAEIASRNRALGS